MENVKRITISSDGDLSVLRSTLKKIKHNVQLHTKLAPERANINSLISDKHGFNPTLKVLIKVMKGLGIKELLIKLDETSNE